MNEDLLLLQSDSFSPLQLNYFRTAVDSFLVKNREVLSPIDTTMTNDKGSGGYKYGSVSNDEESGASSDNKNFDEKNLYYVKEDEQTKRERAAKAIKLAVPIIIAVFLIGGLAFMLFHNFAYFYPGRGGQVVSSKHSVNSGTTKTTQYSYDTDDDQSSPIAIPTSSSTSCAANQKCKDLGLTGECCPTVKGDNLVCCS